MMKMVLMKQETMMINRAEARGRGKREITDQKQTKQKERRK